MKKIMYLSLLFACSISACKKSETPSPSSTTTTTTQQGTIEFINTSKNPYEAYINGSYKGVVNGNDVEKYTVSYGSYVLRVVQKSGYLVYPTEKTATGSVTASKNLSFTFP